MTTKVSEFLSDSGGNNFTETSIRPPVPGEENELHSNGGMSTRSSGSHHSNKSYISSKSVTSNKLEATHSPAVTPRKSSLDKGLHGVDGDVDAPLGFEPEGSTANSPPFSENSTPPHLRWAENLNFLLDDSDGVALFKEYLESEHGSSDELNFWFACQGLKCKANAGDVSNLIKVIFKTYVRFDKVKCISKDTKRDITERLANKAKFNSCIFNEAQTEVEAYLRDVSYPAFLNSDVYVQYVNNYVDSPKSSHSSGSTSVRPISQSGLLPVLHEDKELDTADITSAVSMSLSNCKLVGRRSDTQPLKRAEALNGLHSGYPRSHSSYPAHISYAPVSAQDSELQSHSSDAPTDDTVSLTDNSSIDANMTCNRKRYRKAMKTNALQNREYKTGLHTQIIPRTERAPKDQNIAEIDPGRFARQLIERLGKEVEERETAAKVEEKLRSIRQGREMEAGLFDKSMAKNSTLMSIGDDEESSQSILDNHVAGIWSNTPSQSSGHVSPKSPDRVALTRSKAIQQFQHSETMPADSAANMTFPPRVCSQQKEPCLLKSFDGSVGTERVTRHIHLHHHHHHRDISSKQRSNCTDPSAGGYRRSDDATYEHGRVRSNSRRAAPVWKGSGANSSVESGICVMFKADSSSWNNPTNENSRSGKTDTYVSNCSDSQERSHMVWGTLDAMPSQPFIQDSNMPPPTPPNPTTQLEEAKRRLEERHVDESRSATQVKSKLFPVMPSKEKGRVVPGPVMPLSAYVPSFRTSCEFDLSSSPSMPKYSPSTTRPPHESSTVSGRAPGDSVVVGMYYEQEPIPYRFTVPGRVVTLEQIRHLNTKRGTYKFFFKRDSDEFGEGAVFEEINNDNSVVPTWDGKIVARLQKVD